MLSAKFGVHRCDSIVQRDDAMLFECKENGLTFGLFESTFGQKLLPRYYGIIDLEIFTLKNRPEEASVEIVNENVRVD